MGHLPSECFLVASYFLKRGGKITVEVKDRRRRRKQLCGGMEVVCWVEFSSTDEAIMKRLKEIMTAKL